MGQPLKFTKMHGLGNDYVYISTFDQAVSDPAALARAVSDRHRGIGSDGLILIAPPEAAGAHVRMLMFNVDGSRGEMCGNGIRCVAKYAYEHGLARVSPLKVQTDRGVLTVELTLDADERVAEVRVDMGEPILEPRTIPITLSCPRVVNNPLSIEGANLMITGVSLGNPHVVIFTPELARVPLREWGPRIERHPLFPERVNVHFVQVVRRDFVGMITWERGSGITQACGTGAAAACVAGVLNGVTDRAITARLPGGALRLEWLEAGNHVFMTGPATEVFSGTWPG
jgi:diaminopimelate epimerase